jgi:hypothetical protein
MIEGCSAVLLLRFNITCISEVVAFDDTYFEKMPFTCFSLHILNCSLWSKSVKMCEQYGCLLS